MPPAFAVLVVLLVVSLIASLNLAVRLDDSARDARLNEGRIRALEREVERLRENPPAASGSPSPGATFGSSPIDRIAKAVAQIRGLSFKQGVKPEVLSTDQLRTRVEQEFGKQDARKEIDTTDRVLTALGLLSPNDDLFQIVLGVQTEQVAGYYDNKTKRLVVGGNEANPAPYDRVLLAHELTHALTDQHFDLSRLDRLQDERKDDEATAYLSLVEGDAVLTMFLYRQQFLTTKEQADMDRQADGQTSSRLDAAPAVVRKSLLFPYDRGAIFVNQLLQRGGTAELDRAYRNPPTSTEQIIHPQRFITRDDPQAVTLPDIGKALGGGWRSVDAGGFGELDMQILADQYLAEDDARSAAEGWDGGRYQAFEQSGKMLVALSTAWDSGTEATEAAESLAEWLRPRFGGEGRSYRDGGVAGWESPSGAGEVFRNGSSMVMVIGPDRDFVGRARRSFGS